MSQYTLDSTIEVTVEPEKKQLIRVLHVDDEPSLLKTSKQCLEMEGAFQVDTVSSVGEALEKMKEEQYDAVISDYQMPLEDGLFFLKELRRSGIEIPFIVFTGKGREEVAVNALNLGADYYINKNGAPETVYCELAHYIRSAVEKHRAEVQAKETSQELQAVYQNAIEGISFVDPQENLIYVNKAFAELLGCREEELVGKNLHRFLSEEDWTRVRNETKNRQKGKANRYELVFHRSDGTMRNVQISGSPLFESEGRFVGTVGIVLDLTERKKTEEALRESEKRYSRLSAAAFEGIGISEHGKIVDVNDQLAKMLGYEPSEMIGKAVLDTVAPESRDLVRANMQEGFEGPYEHLALRKDGSVFPVEIRAGLIHFRGYTARVSAIRDISERKKTEKGALESQMKFEGLFACNPEATVYLDSEFRIQDVNPRFVSLFGYSLEEIKGECIDDVVVPKNLCKEAETLTKKAVDGYVYHDTSRMRKDGSLVPVSISAAPILIQGQLIGYIGVYKDISESKKTQINLAIMNEKLRVVGDLTRHDVRNKLSAVTGNAYLLKKHLAGDSNALEKLGDIEAAVKQTVKIFDFAKAYEMLGSEELVYVDVEKSVNEAALLFSRLDGVKVTNDCHGLSVLADSLLRQLFYNMIDNSLKHGQRIANIGIHWEQTSQKELRLVYEDDGVGISQDVKLQLFKEGFSTGGSTGYGLYLIRKMIEVYGWTIQETGEPGKGARFMMTIPETNSTGKPNYRIS